MKKSVIIISIVAIAIIAVLYFLKNEKIEPETTKRDPINWTLETKQIDNGWAYTIYQNGTKTIFQERIPAIPVNTPFESERTAKMVGEKMLEKIKNGKMPSISKSELIEMGIVDSLLQPILQKK
ncbi:DUF4907 domain-containing protein [Marinifilum sp. N1E240]|uniref:DUF4907 domain-containing protein n=1 Tax=Marinifilum sp. N1E240 TaxID=2608082 RepID=UPI00128BA8E4|nr:DUF4907 domain-containing protein [Marinifilum sp. N1E240]MPQ47351.1 DUF4907 domain-containing protein [Marinifilum sp. N1E240]